MPSEPSGETRDVAREAPLGVTAALTIAIVLAVVALLIGALMLVVQPAPIAGLPGTQRQDAETALFLSAFAVVLPLGVLLAPRIADRIAAGANAAGASALVAGLAALLATAVIAARASGTFSWGGGMSSVLVAVGLWAVIAAACLVRAGRDRPWPPLRRATALAGPAWAAAATLWVAAVLTVTDLASLSVVALLLGAPAAAAIVVLVRRGRPGRRLGRRAGAAADALAVVLVGLAVPDLVVVRPEDPALSLLDRYVTVVMQFHHDFLVGPANQLLGGSPMLVDTASQYGVGSIYFLAGWLKLVNIGYGSFALLDGILTGLLFVAGYLLLRLAGGPRPLAMGTLGVAVVALVYNRAYPVGALPQEGPFRFGLPMVVVLATVAGARWPRWRGAARGLTIGALAVSSLWALEAFAYTALTFVALVCAEAYLGEPHGRWRWVARQGLIALGACVAAHMAFALATLLGTGQLPDWGQYIAFIHVFLLGGLGDITYDFSHWSAGLAVGAGYLAAAALLLTVLRRSPIFARRENVAMLALTGLTAYGVVLFAYFTDRSADHVLAYVALPLVLIGALWLSLALSPGRTELRPGARSAALAAALALALLATSVAWSSIGSRFDDSALAHAGPGGRSARAAIARLRTFPPINAAAPAGAGLLQRYMPGERRSYVLVDADLETETLIRSARSNRFPISDPREDDFVPGERRPGLRESISALRAGARILVDRPHLAALAVVRRNPRSRLLTRPGPGTSSLQVWTLREIDRRFRLRTVARDPSGRLVVVELAPR